jgi:hypothetical protein
VGGEVTAKPICDHQFAKIIKRLAVRAGLSAASFSGHSLRSGIATSAAEGGATEHAIMEQTRHRSLKQVRKYIRRAACSKTMPPPRVACDPDGRPRLHSRCDRALPKPGLCGGRLLALEAPRTRESRHRQLLVFAGLSLWRS